MNKHPRYGIREDRHFSTGTLRAAAGESFTLVGTAASYNVLSADLGGFKEKIAPGAFTRSLADPNSDVKCLAQHDPSQILGRQKNGTLKVWTDATGLQFSCKLNPENSQHRDLYSLVKVGTLSDCSFAFTVTAPDGDEWDDRTNPPTRTLRSVSLLDCSVVTSPAYPQTSVDARGKKIGDEKNEGLRDLARKAACAAIGEVVKADLRALNEMQISALAREALGAKLAAHLETKGSGWKMCGFDDESCWGLPKDEFSPDWSDEEAAFHCTRWAYTLDAEGHIILTNTKRYTLDEEGHVVQPSDAHFAKICAELRKDAELRRRMRGAAGIFSR